jgi:hypothetical protein
MLLNSLTILISLLTVAFIFSSNFFHFGFGQAVENWQTYTDPDKTFTLFYPPGWTAKGKANFLSSTDLTLTNTNSPRPFEISITYIINDTSMNYTGNGDIVPANDLHNVEQQLSPTYQQYTFVKSDSSTYSVYGFPTASNTYDYIKHSGEKGRVLNIFAVVKGKNSFFISYTNNKQSFNKLLPDINEIIKSIVILK